MMMSPDNNEDEEQQQQQQQQQQQGSINYYEFFDEITNNGKVFGEDLSDKIISRASLTPGEQETRKAYKAKIERIQKHYKGKNHPVATTKEEVLQQRVVAPCLHPDSVSSRAATNDRRSCRMYPTNIHPWTDFHEEVESYKVDGNAITELDQIFYMSLGRAGTKSTDEADEQIRLLDNLGLTLEDAGIVPSIVKRGKNVKGQPDFIIKSEDNKTSIICECKSTHNLLLPMTAEKCTTAYNTAYTKTNQFKKAWSNVAHPIGQLLWYLIDNGHCYGALTSGTRTYFLKIEVPNHINSHDSLYDTIQASALDHEGDRKKMKMGETSGTPVSCDKGNSQNFDGDDGIKVYISDAWFVGQANYLRAWAYVHNLRQTMQPFKISPNWLNSTTNKGTPEQRGGKPSGNKDDSSSGNNNFKDDLSSPRDKPPPSENKNGGEFGYTCNIEYYYPIHRGAMAFAPYDDIVEVGVLGEGRNGGCFKVQWKGTEYAMKQFDIGKHGDNHFVKEIRAYMMLRDVWGILVPRPIFLSESYSGNVMFLGLQLGRELENENDYKKFQDVIQRLRKYGIRHNDADCGRNMIAITDSNGEERVVAIDFEDWDEVQMHEP